MRTFKEFEAGFLGGLAAAVLATGVTVLLVGAVKRARDRKVIAANNFSIDSIPPKGVNLDAQPAPEANASGSPRLESEMNDVMIPSQRW